MRKFPLLSIVLLAGTVVLSACAAGPPEIAGPATSSGATEQEPGGAPDEETMPMSEQPTTRLNINEALEGEDPICPLIDWTPISDVMTNSSIDQTGTRTTLTRNLWEVDDPEAWNFNPFTPAGDALFTRCSLELSSAGDPSYSFGTINAEITAFEEPADAVAFTSNWSRDGFMPTDAPVDIAGANQAWLGPQYGDTNEDLFVFSSHYVLFISDAQVGGPDGSNSESRGPADPDSAKLAAAYRFLAKSLLENLPEGTAR